jgi:hypothetical protein
MKKKVGGSPKAVEKKENSKGSSKSAPMKNKGMKKMKDCK